MPTIYQIIIITLLAAFIILWSMKTEYRYLIRDKFDTLSNRKKNKVYHLIAEMLDCDFCLSFWVSLAVAFYMYILTFDYSWLIVPFLSTPLIRFII